MSPALTSSMNRVSPGLVRCLCLCAAMHPAATGICEAFATTHLMKAAAGVGRVYMPVCGPCAVAHKAHQRRTQEPQ